MFCTRTNCPDRKSNPECGLTCEDTTCQIKQSSAGINKNDLRLCIYKGETCYFHLWTDLDKSGGPYALVELPNGCLETANCRRLRFIDEKNHDLIKIVIDKYSAEPCAFDNDDSPTA